MLAQKDAPQPLESDQIQQCDREQQVARVAARLGGRDRAQPERWLQVAQRGIGRSKVRVEPLIAQTAEALGGSRPFSAARVSWN